MKKIVALLNFFLVALIASVSNSNSVDYYFSSAKILSSDDELTVFELDCLNYGIEIDDGFDISASMSVTNGLDITSATNAATNHFEIKYWYKNGENDYNHNSIVYYAMFNFICDEGGEELGISPTRFPLITFETTYHGFYYFMGHTRKFYARPFTTRPNDFDVPTT